MINLKRSRMVASMAIISSVLALVVATISLLNENIYEDVLEKGTITEFGMNGAMGQDVVTVLFSLILIVLSVYFLIKPGEKLFMFMIGFIGYLMYGYGLLVIEAYYTSFYLIYIMIFGLSIYALIFSFISFNMDIVEKYRLPKKVKISTIIFLMLIILILGPAWISKVMGGISEHTPPSTYSVLINDLALVFPAFAITIILLIRNIPFGNILGGIMLLKTFTICFSWGFAQWFVVVFDMPIEYDMAIIASVLTLVSCLLIYFFMKGFKPKEKLPE